MKFILDTLTEIGTDEARAMSKSLPNSLIGYLIQMESLLTTRGARWDIIKTCNGVLSGCVATMPSNPRAAMAWNKCSRLQKVPNGAAVCVSIPENPFLICPRP